MKIWLTRHGQTNLNKKRLMQGLTDEPLNETGIAQAKAARERIGDVHFDAVYASPLQRAIMTGAIIGGVSPEEVLIDKRLIETDFGRYEQRPFYRMGPFMTLYWTLPEVFFPLRLPLRRLPLWWSEAVPFSGSWRRRSTKMSWSPVTAASSARSAAISKIAKTGSAGGPGRVTARSASMNAGTADTRL